MPGPESVIKGIVSTAKPAVLVDGVDTELRLTRFHEQFVNPIMGSYGSLADEGSFFVALSPTMGTGLVSAIQTTFSDTSGIFSIKNNAASGGPRLYLAYLKLICTVAPASATSMHFAVKVDDTASRYSSGGTALSPVNINGGSTATSNAASNVNAGALVLTAATGINRLVGRGVGRSVIAVVGDEIILTFGTQEWNQSIAGLGGTVAQRIVVPFGPVVAAPGQWITVHYWVPANATTAGSYEVEAGWYER